MEEVPMERVPRDALANSNCAKASFEEKLKNLEEARKSAEAAMRRVEDQDQLEDDLEEAQRKVSSLEWDLEQEKEERIRDLVNHQKYKKKIDTSLLATKDRIRHARVEMVKTFKASADF
ncbi:putative methyltransferase PMT21 [Cocos nucifera]|uniref:Putative methyltransferase PMT21 n=1 Tax=Cocos nucifera TaxID=13894 RepID=A0A8K0MX52_COCNU|nr:putative methyltransferase PMT21 [Cocos nucifera]